MILLIDNYDSFVWNLARYVSELGHKRLVMRNDALDLAAIETLVPTHIIISPGPCTPDEAGISNAVIERFGAYVPILGICLGH
jgi:anthranilate synthase/aminodeoxychorismate synthase-like glutamine amidotransferase